jgi:cytochrome c oxidase subunit 3/cytochrome o ubiquinol oxidase subunit 3
MAADTTTSPSPVPDAGHDTSFGVPNDKMGLWALIGSECLFFGAFITTYLLYLDRTEPGPGPELFDIPFTSVSTFILLMSSLGMVLALAAIQQGDMRRFRIWTLGTALMGLTFLSGQMYEFTVFVEEGLGLTTSPFSTSFFVLTGFHGAHVAVGVLMLLTLWASSFTGHIKPGLKESQAVENVGLYWHFVDIVWIIIFTVIYLIPAE